MKIETPRKIAWAIRRHPFLFYFRYFLMSKNFTEKNSDDIGCFNDINEMHDIPIIFFEVNRNIGINSKEDEFERALAIAAYLRNNIKGGKGLGLSSNTTLKNMIDGQGGVCSDFSLIFNIFCFINGIKVKEWGCVDRFYKSRFGHTFNEIYSSKLEKWIAIDCHKGMYFTAYTSTPLSAMELFQYLRSGNSLKYTFISDYVPKSVERTKYVYSKSTMPFIINNYNNSVYDYYLNKFQNVLPAFVINALLILLKLNHHFVFILDNYKKKLLPSPLQKIYRA